MKFQKSEYLSILLFLLLGSFGCKSKSEISKQENKGNGFNITAQNHKQTYSMSCIPMAVEMVLKHNKKVTPEYFELQHAWQNKADGSFRDFDGKTIAGMRFTHRFKEERGDNFPIEDLYKTIADELAAGRKVIISLPSGANLWHMYVLNEQTPESDFAGYSRGYNVNEVLQIKKVKEIIKTVKGTDILTYELIDGNN